MMKNKTLKKDLETNEYIFIFIVWIIIYIIYKVIFDFLGNRDILIISFVDMAFIKSIYDIYYVSGSKKMYAFSTVINQRLRYLVCFVSAISVILFNYITFFAW
jgi:hypothetical protein